ncbi:hypothetical protein ACQR2L_19215 (plasmid) [Clostridium butyricum]|uniref:hypothetical protein n=1 Tax=Clostridium butyricum TaxID=1492 RepID=UPI003D0F3679
MDTSNNFSPIMQNFMMNEINVVIQKYNNIKLEEVEKIESLLLKISDEKFKEELLKDFDEALKIAIELGDNDLSSNQINLYLWLRKNIDKGIQVNDVIRYSEEIELSGYIEVDETSIIYKKGSCLKDLAREKLEHMLESSYFVDKLLDKDLLVEYWMNGTSKDEIIEELVDGVEIEELLGFSMDTITINKYSDEYIYAEIDC